MSGMYGSIVIPTRNRREVLLSNLVDLVPAAEGLAEVIVVDNASQDGVAEALAGAFPSVRVIRLERNHSAAARNVGAEQARGDYLVMLDDDSVIDRASLRLIPRAFDAQPDLAAIGCLTVRDHAMSPAVRYESGGLPGVFIGCGAAVRREDWLAVRGYPASYGYYVEEYDLCCQLWQRGRRVAWFDDIRVTHQRSQANRDVNRMLRYLARNNLRLWDRFGPSPRRDALIDQTIERYARIARKENAHVGYEKGLAEGRALLARGCRRKPLSEAQFRSLFGMDVAVEILADAAARMGVRRVAMVGRGKGAEQVLECLAEVGIDVTVVIDECGAGQAWQGRSVVGSADAYRGLPDALVVGSLSPGAVRDMARAARAQISGLPVVSCTRLATSAVLKPLAVVA